MGIDVTATQMDGLHQAWFAVHQLIAEFAYSVDVGNGRHTAELFTDDGWYESDTGRSTGRDAIREAYRRRADRGPRTSRHIYTNVRIKHTEGNRYQGTSLLLLFAEDGERPSSAEPLLVADVEDEYVIENGTALLGSRRLRNVFVSPVAEPVLPLGGN